MARKTKIDIEHERVMKNHRIYNRPWANPHRPFAIEAMIAAVLVAGTPLGIWELTKSVEKSLDWAPRAEVHLSITRMIKQGRIEIVEAPGRTLPLYTLPKLAHAPHAASPSCPS